MGESGDGDSASSTDRPTDPPSSAGPEAAHSSATPTGSSARPPDERSADAAPQIGTRPAQAPPAEDGFGWRGWVLVGMVILSFLVVPWTLISLPAADQLLDRLGLSLRDTYLALPMIPAIGLAVVAVWAAVRSRAR